MQWCHHPIHFCYLIPTLSLSHTSTLPSIFIHFAFSALVWVAVDKKEIMVLMGLIHTFLNLTAPPFTFVFLCLFLPPYWAFMFFHSTLNSIFNTENIAGKVVLITGASSGIGEHLAYEYAKRGARLALCARRENQLREVADTARDYGSPDVITIRADVSTVEDCRRLVDETVNHFGRLDHLVNNAGISGVSTFEETTDVTNLRPIMDINFWGSVYTTHYAVPHLKDTKGKIVVLSSASAWLPAPRHTVYNASKAALLSMYETLRVEFGPQTHITIVTPGYIESEITQGKYLQRAGKIVFDQDTRDAQVGPVPVGTVTSCAKSIVNSTLRGDRYLTEPSWFSMTHIWKVLCPELLEWSYRMFYMSRTGTPATEAPSKKILDFNGVKKVLYPESIQSHEVKVE
ncbi:11-beta-hydroxysteroid dehydrogenase [Quillaja saponaria]|uniref:11-beta-hydroxysteroid dehydrogenase n=1 Tax=Quillaja saponaria TaxID=32244 RepID=A0AAD7P8H8_QUISA|nr:11-beta-hydroxysteroid dehydrogenase [Quillaja saponaria]